MRKPDVVIQAVTEALSTMGNAGRGSHNASLGASRIIYDTRERLAQFFNAENPMQVVFTMNSTESLNIAIKGILEKGDHAITTALEHNSVLRPLYEMEEKGVELTIIPADKQGCIDYADFEKNIRQNTKVIVCTHGSNLTGNVVDIRKVGEIAKKHDILFVVDASQTAGVFPIDVQEMKIDILCFTGHKGLLGPQGDRKRRPAGETVTVWWQRCADIQQNPSCSDAYSIGSRHSECPWTCRFKDGSWLSAGNRSGCHS